MAWPPARVGNNIKSLLATASDKYFIKMKNIDHSTTKHLIFGAGLIGGFMAGSFAASGLNVSVFGREKYRQRFSGKLLLTDYAEQSLTADNIDFYAEHSAVTEPFDYVWLTVKATGLDQALADVAALVRPETVLISCQNGLGSEHRVETAFPHHTVLRAVMQSNVAELGESHLHRGSQGTLELPEYEVGGQGLAKLVASNVLPAASVKNIEASAWAKLLLNLSNAVNALADVPVREMLENHGYRKIIAQSMRELIAVTDAKNINLPKISAVPTRYIPSILNLPNWLFEIVGRSMIKVDPTVRTSMWWDLHNGRMTEVDYLNGAVVTEALSIGLESPMNQRIVELVHKVEQSAERISLSPEKIKQ